MGHFHGEAVRSVLAKVWGDVFTHFHAVAAECHSRTQNSHIGLLGQILCAQPLDIRESDDHAVDSAFHLYGLFGLGDVGLFHWEDCCFVSES